MHLAVIIPMFNEEAGARRCLDRVLGALAVERQDTGVIVVNDGSSDGTLLTLQAALDSGLDFELVDSSVNRGYGGALRLGAERASALGADWVVFMDSDLTNPPEQIADFRRSIEAEAVDFVKACRYCATGSTGDVPFRRMIVSRVGNLVARALAGVDHRDLTNGFRAFRTRTYLEMPLTELRFAVILEEMYWARRLELVGIELPSTLSKRAAELRPTSFAYTPSTLWSYLRWPTRAARERIMALICSRRR